MRWLVVLSTQRWCVFGTVDTKDSALLLSGDNASHPSPQKPVGNAAPALVDWLASRGETAGPLFWGLGNRNHRGRLTDQAVYNMLRKRAKLAGVAGLSPHEPLPRSRG